MASAVNFVTGKNVVITGCTAGIGKAFLKLILPSSPNKVIMVARSESKVQELRDEVKGIKSSVDLQYVLADLGKPKDVQSACGKIKALLGGEKLGLLINNAGIMTYDKNKKHLYDENNLELHFRTNYLSMVILLKGLIDVLTPEIGSSSSSRVVITGSFTAWMYQKNKVEFDNLQGEKKANLGFMPNQVTYSQSKLLQHVYAKYLAKKLQDEGKKVNIIVFDPGYVDSDIDAIKSFKKNPLWGCFRWMMSLRTTAQGAGPGVWAATATDEEVGTGTYVDWNLTGDGVKRKPVPIGDYPYAKAHTEDDPAREKKVVEVTENLLKKLGL